MAPGRLTPLFLAWGLLLAFIGSGFAQDTLTLLKSFEFGRNRRAWNSMDIQVRAERNRERRAAEQQLIEVLLGRDSTTDAKILACRGLRYVGTNPGVEVLLSLVKDERLSAEACAALQEKDFKEINPALRTALPLAPNDLKAGLMNTLARRRDREAAPVIGKIARSISDRPVLIAALDALGQIGGVEGLTALQQLASKNPDLEVRRKHALLAAAGHALRQDALSKDLALKILNQFMAPSQPPLLRGAAMVEVAMSDKDQRAQLCLQALKSSTGTLLPAAASILSVLEVGEFIPLYTEHFDSLKTPAQILLVELWKPEYRDSKRIQDLSLNTKIDPNLRHAATRAIDRSR